MNKNIDSDIEKIMLLAEEKVNSGEFQKSKRTDWIKWIEGCLNVKVTEGDITIFVLHGFTHHFGDLGKALEFLKKNGVIDIDKFNKISKKCISENIKNDLGFKKKIDDGFEPEIKLGPGLDYKFRFKKKKE